MFRILAKGLFGRALSYAGIAFGFWLLFQAFSRPNPALGIAGGAMILAAMYLLVQGRQGKAGPPAPGLDDSPANSKEESVDSLDGGGPGGKLPP